MATEMKIVLKLEVHDDRQKQRVLKALSTLHGMEQMTVDMEKQELTVIGSVDPVLVAARARKICPSAQLFSVGPAKKEDKKFISEKKEEKKFISKKKEEKKYDSGRQGQAAYKNLMYPPPHADRWRLHPLSTLDDPLYGSPLRGGSGDHPASSHPPHVATIVLPGTRGGETEAPISVSLGAIGSLLGLLDVVPAPRCKLPKGVKDRLHLLKDDLEEIRAYLEDLSELEDPPLTAKCWMKEVHELSYDIEDRIYNFVRPARVSIRTRFLCKKSRQKIVRKISHVKIQMSLKRHKRIVNMISDFRIYTREAIERHERYELGFLSTFRHRFVSIGPMLPTLYEVTADLVIDGQMTGFVSSLASDSDQQLKVVSVLGPGCLGKTTLAKVFYNKFGGQFDCRAFVRVSQKPDINSLLRDMLSQVQRQQSIVDCQELELIDNIRKHLMDKRYLIIIDDLWTESVWDIINEAFPENNRRSRIITTTQVENVALSCCCHLSGYVFEMKPLHYNHSRKLFFNRLFGSESDCPQQFKDVFNSIVEVCGGLPLATINIASLLASQSVIQMDLLVYIRDSLNSSLWAYSISEGMRQVLNLSYNNLPCYLKTCLLYLSMYPKRCIIFNDDLVKQWVAEGFLNATERRYREKVARSYLYELIARRFIQPVGINYYGKVLSCTIHDVVHDLIAYKSVEQNFVMVVDCYGKNVELCDKVRRLSLHLGDAKCGKIPANIGMSQVRSLSFFGYFECMPSLMEFKLLRILNLQLSSPCGNDTVDLIGISALYQLRYLKISGDVCIKLPNHMRVLQCLETLDIGSKLSSIPWDIIHLPCLVDLHLPVERNMLDYFGSMRSVGPWSLGKLNNLQCLHLTCSPLPTNHLERSMEALGSALGGHGNLKTLALVPDSSHKKVMVPGVSEVIVSWDGMAPPHLLHRFEWSLRSCILYQIPNWMGELGNLCILKIAVRRLLRNCVSILKGLPALTALSLYVRTASIERIVFDKAGFSALKYFKIRCCTPWLKFEVDAMPNLQNLKLGFSDQKVDGTPVINIEHLPGLEEIFVKIWSAGAGAEHNSKNAVRNDPRNPRIKVQLMESFIYGENTMEKLLTHMTRLRWSESQEVLLAENAMAKCNRAEDGNKQADSKKDGEEMRKAYPTGSPETSGSLESRLLFSTAAPFLPFLW